jgi:hypothetical protein
MSKRIIDSAFSDGFIKRCAEVGISPTTLITRLNLRSQGIKPMPGLLKVADAYKLPAGFQPKAYSGTGAPSAWSRWQERHPFASTAAYFVPGVGTGMLLGDAASAFGEGRFFSGLGNLGLGVLSIVPGGAAVAGLSRASRIARLAKKFGRSKSAVRGLARVANRVPAMGTPHTLSRAKRLQALARRSAAASLDGGVRRGIGNAMIQAGTNPYVDRFGRWVGGGAVAHSLYGMTRPIDQDMLSSAYP